MAVRQLERGQFLRLRTLYAFFLILTCYLVLVARLFYLQAQQGSVIAEQATAERQAKIPIRAHRGSLSDREGRPLAVSLYAGKIGFDTQVVQPIPGDPKASAKLAARLTDSIARAALILQIPQPQLDRTIRDALARYNPAHPQRFIVLKKGVPLEVATQIRECKPPLLGFGVGDGTRRVYSSADNAAQLVGFVNVEGVPQAGMERGCNKWLHGDDGYAIAELDNQHREIPDTQKQLKPAHDGLDVHTTIDANIQHICLEEARKTFDKFHPVGVSVVVVAPDTGDILALTSLPTFDPADRHTVTPEALAERCAQRLYEPGSTLKTLTIAAALDNGTITTGSHFYCSSAFRVGKHTIHDAHGEAHGDETASDILRESCNIGAAQVGLRMGSNALYAADTKFGLLEPHDMGLPGVNKGYLSMDANENIHSAAKVARVAFGHSITSTPLNVALAYAAIANGGVLMQPRLVTSVSSGNRTVQKWEPQIARRVVAPKTAETVCEMLRGVVANGTGRTLALPGYQIAGKTGTASKYRRGAYVGSFAGFLPASPNVKPRAVILVVVDEPTGNKYYGAEVAGPAFQEIARRLMAYWHVPEDDPESLQARTAQENVKRAARGQKGVRRVTTVANVGELD